MTDKITFVLWLTALSVHCTLLQAGCTIIFNGLDLHSVLSTKRHSWRRAAAALQDQGGLEESVSAVYSDWLRGKS